MSAAPDCKRRRRWGDSAASADAAAVVPSSAASWSRKTTATVPSPGPVSSSTKCTRDTPLDNEAVAALIASSAPKEEEGGGSGQKRGRGDGGRFKRQQQQGRGRQEDGQSGHGQSGGDRWGGPARVENDPSTDRWGGDHRDGNTQPTASPTGDAKPKEKQKADFGLSGALASDERTGNVYNGVVLKFTEPPEARAPNTRWRLYVFKKKSSVGSKAKGGKDDDELLEVLHISRQSAYLLGRDRRVVDVPLDHPSLSSQHAVIQYRALPDPTSGDPNKLRCRPYIMDLESTNGTFLNEVKIEDARYYELRKGDVIKFGGSTREYVLLTEHATSAGTSAN
mmetsp:Transcript_21165/g.61558  ORF Transcript_21165/g.61558 Transcript_21165/m.61558 type:complete len:337 (-) Transcript_21165:317-1327(-)